MIIYAITDLPGKTRRVTHAQAVEFIRSTQNVPLSPSAVEAQIELAKSKPLMHPETRCYLEVVQRAKG